MIVIAILGIFMISIGYLMQNTQLDQEKAMRFAGIVYDHIRDARQDMIIGRGTQTGTTGDMVYIPSQARIIEFFGTWEVNIKYIPLASLSAPGSPPEQLLQVYEHPFLDNEREYVIHRYEISTSPLTQSWALPAGAVWEPVNRMKLIFAGAWNVSRIEIDSWIVGVSWPVRSYRITLGYKNFVRYIVGDVLSGFAEVHNTQPDLDP